MKFLVEIRMVFMGVAGSWFGFWLALKSDRSQFVPVDTALYEAAIFVGLSLILAAITHRSHHE